VDGAPMPPDCEHPMPDAVPAGLDRVQMTPEPVSVMLDRVHLMLDGVPTMLDRASVMSDKASPGLDGFPAILDDLPTTLDCVPTMLDTPNPRSSAKNMANIGRPPRADAFLGGDGLINRYRRRTNAD